MGRRCFVTQKWEHEDERSESSAVPLFTRRNRRSGATACCEDETWEQGAASLRPWSHYHFLEGRASSRAFGSWFERAKLSRHHGRREAPFGRLRGALPSKNLGKTAGRRACGALPVSCGSTATAGLVRACSDSETPRGSWDSASPASSRKSAVRAFGRLRSAYARWVDIVLTASLRAPTPSHKRACSRQYNPRIQRRIFIGG